MTSLTKSILERGILVALSMFMGAVFASWFFLAKINASGGMALRRSMEDVYIERFDLENVPMKAVVREILDRVEEEKGIRVKSRYLNDLENEMADFRVGGYEASGMLLIVAQVYGCKVTELDGETIVFY